VISINADTLVGLAMILSAVVFMLGHAAGYWRAKDVERRRRARAHHPAGRAR
jgi:hypothetical protein